MRCQFCGWDNPQGKETCEKCNKPLAKSSSSNYDRPTDRRPEAYSSEQVVRPVKSGLAGTLREGEAMHAGAATVLEHSVQCPQCGYTMENGVCPNCGHSQHEAKEPVKPVFPNTGNNADDSDLRKTIRPHRKEEKEGTFTLVPISEETGQPEGEPLAFEGNNVILNRDNTDPKNSTITSLCQATISRENGEWAIEDGSEYKTTFVQASRKIVLQEGDLILLGNQLYRFGN